MGKMEIESENGSKIRVQQNFDLGRGFGGFNSSDRTVSRHHLSFNLHQDGTGTGTGTGTGVYFQVNGKNPIWVRHCHGDDIRVYKSSEQGELKTGDSFCLSSKNPVWFHLKKIACQEDETFDEIDTGDVSDIDPVKEFSFVVMGHEFDCYTKKMIRDIKNWNWFLEEPNKDSDDDDDTNEKNATRKGGTIKRKKGDDDVWTGESEEEFELVKKSRNDLKPKYSTRSKDKTHKKGMGASKSAKDNAKRKATSDDDDEEEDDDDDDDDDDETLGGFIVDDEDIGEGNEENDEEEEFEEDEDDE